MIDLILWDKGFQNRNELERCSCTKNDNLLNHQRKFGQGFRAILIFNTAGIPTAYRQDDYRGLLSMRQDNSNLPGCEVLCLHKKYIMTPPQSLETLLQYVALSSIFNPWQYPGLTVNPVYTRKLNLLSEP